MTTKQIAQRLIALAAKQKFSEARLELYAEDVVCQEADNKEISGLQALDKKQKTWMDSMEKIHSLKISKPLVNGNFFSIAFTWDVTYKDQPRGGWKEIGLYQVKYGKIILEKYFY
ncbi:MAG TPA: hypothetical protein P5280_12905 [Cyclobacteriaceae bacterium]|nr:hypothetical protein [Cyclobacteriaceae bacterium]